MQQVAGFRWNINVTRLAKIPVHWSYFEVFPALPFQRRLQIANDKVQVFGRVAKRLTVIGKRQRYQAATCEPTFYTTEDQAVSQLSRGRGRGEYNRPVAVRALERPKPGRRMEHGSPRVPLDELRPPPVPDRINLIYVHLCELRLRERSTSAIYPERIRQGR
jgi:hypothetical protein